MKKINNSTCISLYDICNLLREKYVSTSLEEERLLNDVRKESKLILGLKTEIIINDIDNDNTLTVNISTSGRNNYEKIKFSKTTDGMYIIESSLNNIDKFNKIKYSLSKVYDFLNNNLEISKQKSENVRSINSNFIVNIFSYNIEIKCNKKFDINYLPSLDYYNINYCEYNKIVNDKYIYDIKDDLKYIFKNVYVNIEECPKWMQEKLYMIRKNRLEDKEYDKIRKMKVKKLSSRKHK